MRARAGAAHRLEVSDHASPGSLAALVQWAAAVARQGPMVLLHSPRRTRGRWSTGTWTLATGFSDILVGRENLVESFTLAAGGWRLRGRARGRPLPALMRRLARPFRDPALGELAQGALAARHPFLGGPLLCLGYAAAEQVEDAATAWTRGQRGATRSPCDWVALVARAGLTWDPAPDRVLRWQWHGTPDLCGPPFVAGLDRDAAPSVAAQRLALWQPPRLGWIEAQHEAAVEALLQAIHRGDIYQACLTFPLYVAGRLGGESSGHSAAVGQLFHRLIDPPPPFAAWWSLPRDVLGSLRLDLLSASPELLLRVDGQGWATSRPMKGTRPRGREPVEDEALRRELARSAKDRAENLMIVDLARHDLGRLARPGSVTVPELFHVESYPTVHQMTSCVQVHLDAPYDAFDALLRLFPPGSMTGAPRIRARQILAGVETWTRGLYSGAMGWFDGLGRADFAVSIRSLVLTSGDGGRLLGEWGVGGAIVADSTPQGEWAEATWKARRLGRALASIPAAAPP